MSDIVLSEAQREIGAIILNRIEADPSFAERVDADPIGALSELGLHEEVIPYVLLEAVQTGLYGDEIPEEPEVEGMTWPIAVTASIRFCAATSQIAINCAQRATVCIRTRKDK